MSDDGGADIEMGPPRVAVMPSSNAPQEEETLPEGAIEGKMQASEEAAVDLDVLSERAKPPSIASTILAIIFAAIGMLTPSLLIWHSGRFITYSFAEVKIGSPQTNEQMEFIRWSIFIFMAYSGFLVIEWLIAALPARLVALLKWLHQPPSPRTQRHLSYVIKARRAITMVVWMLFLGIEGANLLYRSNFIQSVGSSLLGKAPEKKAEAAIQNITPLRNEWFYFECALLVASLGSVLIGAAYYLVQLIKVHFHRWTYEARITDLNFRFQVLTKLYTTLEHPGKKIKLDRKTESILLTDQRNLMSTERKVVELAQKLFDRLVPSNRDYLTIDDLAPHFEPTDLPDAFGVLDQAGHGDLERGEVKETILEVFQQRRSVFKGIINNDEIVKKLEHIMFAVAIFFTITLAIPILNLGGAAILAVWGLLWTSLGFLLQGTAKSVFECLIFLFVEHAYDVGDRVVIDGEFLTVEKVEIFTTIFRRWDGTAVYIPNSTLSGKSIYNIRRSDTQADTIDIALVGDTPIVAIWTLRDRLVDFTRSEPKDYTGTVEIVKFEADGDKAKLQLMVQYRTNFQDPAVRAARKNKFTAMMNQYIKDLDITMAS